LWGGAPAALEFHGINVGAKFSPDQVRSALGVQDLKCEQVDYDIIPTECTAQANIDGLSTQVMVGVDKEGGIAQVSFTVEHSQFNRFEQICMTRLGTPSSRTRIPVAVQSETWLENWFFADGSRASLIEYSAAEHGSSLLMLLSQKNRDRTGL
jgi:hypothetical protein